MLSTLLYIIALVVLLQSLLTLCNKSEVQRECSSFILSSVVCDVTAYQGKMGKTRGLNNLSKNLLLILSRLSWYVQLKLGGNAQILTDPHSHLLLSLRSWPRTEGRG